MSQERPTPAPRNVPPIPRKRSIKRQNDSTKPNTCEFHVISLSPSSVIYNKHESVIVVFNQSLPSNVEFTIKFVGYSTGRETSCAAQKIGDNVLTFRAPEHYPPEETKMFIHHGNYLTKLCSHNSFSFKSYLEQMRDILIRVNDPVEFMCAALHLKQKNSIALDFELERLFRKNQPPNFDLLSSDPQSKFAESDAAGFNPTLLHFAARYNLIKLALAILKCPGGYNALNIKNLDDLNPSGIASECGHEHLAFVLADAQQHQNLFLEAEELYERMHDPIYDTYVRLQNDEEEIYERMDNDHHYETMVGFGEESGDIYQNPDINDYLTAQYCRDYRAPDAKSLCSISSNSSNSSNGSRGSVSSNGGAPQRPPMPSPRLTSSCDETAFKETLSSLNRGGRFHSEKGEDRYVRPPTKGYQDFGLSSYHDQELPPLPSRKPNAND